MSRYLIPKGEKKQMKYVYERRKPKESKRKLVTDRNNGSTSLYRDSNAEDLISPQARLNANLETNRIIKELFYSDKKDDKKHHSH